MTITPKNRFLFLSIATAALTLLLAAAGNAQGPARPDRTKPSPTPTPKPLCPLPANYGVDKTVTREKPLMAVCHNGMVLCLPAPAAKAHIAHGDTPLGPCNKPGKQGPCP